MREKKSIIHIGLHKTGSTTLQRALYQCRNELAAQKFFYPADYFPHKSQHSDLALLLRKSNHDAYHKEFGRVLADLEKLDGAQLILSGEEFSTLGEKAEIVRESLEPTGRQFQVVVYVRNLYRFAVSVLAERSKGGGFIAYPAEVMDQMKKFNLPKMLSAWENAFGEENVHVFCLEALPPGSTIVTQFADFAGISLPPDLADRRLNRSVDPVASALLSHLAYEFGVPSQLFCKAYFQAAGDSVVLPKTQNHLSAIFDKWVEQVSLAHPKLAPYREILVERPHPNDDRANGSGAEYLKLLGKVLTKTAARLDRHAKKNAKAASNGAGSDSAG